MKGNIEIKSGSERSFGIVFAFVFLIIGLYPLISSGDVRIWSLVIAALLIAITLLRPSLFKYPNAWWFKFGLLLGSIVAPIIMGLVFVVTIIPTGIIMKLLGKDLLHLKFDRMSKTYWVKREAPPQSMKQQF